MLEPIKLVADFITAIAIYKFLYQETKKSKPNAKIIKQTHAKASRPRISFSNSYLASESDVRYLSSSFSFALKTKNNPVNKRNKKNPPKAIQIKKPAKYLKIII